jgi:hypothetical protein
MNKAVSLILLIVGVILLVYGISAADSLGSDVSEVVTGAPTDKSLWLIIGGVVGIVLGGWRFLGRGKRA